ncbi:MAG: DUF309 domain-containing protein [Blastocatellia bacterium]
MPLSPACLPAVELFNRGAYFACHEALEPLWLAASEPERTLLHALIQAAAALHHLQRGNQKGARSVWQRAKEKMLALPPHLIEPELNELLPQIEAALDSGTAAFALPQIKLTSLSAFK